MVPDMRDFIVTGAAFALLASTAFAQQPAPPAQHEPQNNAINSSSTPPPSAPVAGRNSFTQGEAKSRIEARGFTNISDLQKDDYGVWRGQATKDGQTVSVSVDYQGNVVTR